MPRLNRLRNVLVGFVLGVFVGVVPGAAAADVPQPGVLGIKLVPSLAIKPRIASIVPGGPADEAGLWNGDSIVAVDGVALSNYHDLIRVVRERPAGTIVTLDIVREQFNGALQGKLKVQLTDAAQIAALEHQAELDALPEARPGRFGLRRWTTDDNRNYQKPASDSMPYFD
jgi:membrane-associated protease RseP (regulator of RpoE activity)